MNEPFCVCPKPNCKSENLDTGDWEVDSQWVWRDVRCKKCGFTWHEVYIFQLNETRDTCVEIDENGEPFENIVLEPVKN
jgi:hypothetical protein